jgi:hypothetical protein
VYLSLRLDGYCWGRRLLQWSTILCSVPNFRGNISDLTDGKVFPMPAFGVRQYLAHPILAWSGFPTGIKPLNVSLPIRWRSAHAFQLSRLAPNRSKLTILSRPHSFFPSFTFSKFGFLAILSNWRFSNTHRPFRSSFQP